MRMNKIGPKTVPCETPLLTISMFDNLAFIGGSLSLVSEELLEPIEYFSSDSNPSNLFKHNGIVNLIKGLVEIQIYDIHIRIIVDFDGMKDTIAKVY